jgi:hypothetical protein
MNLPNTTTHLEYLHLTRASPRLTRLRLELYGLRYYIAAAAASLVLFAIMWMYSIHINEKAAIRSLGALPIVFALQLPCVALFVIGPAASVSTFAELRSSNASLDYLAQPIPRKTLFHEKRTALVCLLLPVWLCFYAIVRLFPADKETVADAISLAPNFLAIVYVIGIYLGACTAILIRHSVAALLVSITLCFATMLGTSFLESLATHDHPTLYGLPHVLGYNLFTWFIIGAVALTCYVVALRNFQQLEVRP